MYQFMYVSSAIELFSEPQLLELLEVSRTRNASCGVTGILLYVRGNFIQLLEGEREEVEATRARIVADPRHRGLITLLEGACAARDFPEWSMGFPRLSEAEAAQVPGYSDFLQDAGAGADTQTAARKLLAFFKELNVPSRAT